MGNSQSTPPPAQGAEACPIDPKARQAWLDQAKAQQAQQPSQPSPSSKTSQYPSMTYTTDKNTTHPFHASPEVASSITSQLNSVLSTTREVSTIPRGPTSPNVDGHSPSPSSTPILNAEQQGLTSESENEKSSGNWIYPSPRMFLDALKRKNLSAEPSQMSTIVPIHNAVNERVWHEIKRWESSWGTATCGGPFSSTQPYLESFHGLGANNPSPRARWNALLGYQKPFDRHEWVINRCGRKVEYVIDFYSGRDERVQGKSLNFYLDVRPKLNTWEGWAMRGARFVGLEFESPPPNPGPGSTPRTS